MAIFDFFRKKKKEDDMDIRYIDDVEIICRTSQQAMELWEKLSTEHPEKCYRAGLHTGGTYANWFYVREYSSI